MGLKRQEFHTTHEKNQSVTMAFEQKSFKLNTGAHIPAIGLGTWQDEDLQEQAVLTALHAGYRHIDTARW